MLRGNRWAAKKSLHPINRWTILDWRREGLVPGPSPRGRGRGHGKAECWSQVAYWRILKLTRLRAAGWKRRQDQRLRLWLFGADLDPELIRDDFRRLVSTSTNEMRRRLRPWRWSQPMSLQGLPVATKRVARELLDFTDERSLAKHFGLSVDHPLLAQVDIPLLNKAMENVIQVATAQLFFAQWETNPALIESAVAQLPEYLQRDVGDDIKRFTRGLTGAFVEPDIDDMSLEAILDRTPASELIRLRAFTFEWANLLAAFGRLFTQEGIARQLPHVAQVFDLTKAGLILRSPGDRAEFILMFLRLETVDASMRKLVDGIEKTRIGTVLLKFGQALVAQPERTPSELDQMLCGAGVGRDGRQILLGGTTHASGECGFDAQPT